jgi:NAD(P)-dependent dehydrogenase (short-subunit alcohol dehydrogenase family)
MHCEPRQRPHRQRRLDLGTSRDANDSPYVASKFALKGMTDVLRRELRPQDIDIVMIEPGGVKAPLMNKSSQEIQKILLDVPPGLVQRHGAMITTVLEKVKGHGVPEWTRVWWLRLSARRWPRNRYLVDRDAIYAATMVKFVPDRVMDRLLLSLTRSS